MLCDACGVPLSFAVAGANRHDSKLLKETLANAPSSRPLPDEANPQNLCLDAGYDGEPCREIAKSEGFIVHVRPRGEEKKLIERDPSFKPRRWVVERAHSWLNRFRKLLVSFEKTRTSFVGLLSLACALVAWRQTIFIHE